MLRNFDEFDGSELHAKTTAAGHWCQRDHYPRAKQNLLDWTGDIAGRVDVHGPGTAPEYWTLVEQDRVPTTSQSSEPPQVPILIYDVRGLGEKGPAQHQKIAIALGIPYAAHQLTSWQKRLEQMPPEVETWAPPEGDAGLAVGGQSLEDQRHPYIEATASP